MVYLLTAALGRKKAFTTKFLMSDKAGGHQLSGRGCEWSRHDNKVCLDHNKSQQDNNRSRQVNKNVCSDKKRMCSDHNKSQQDNNRSGQVNKRTCSDHNRVCSDRSQGSGLGRKTRFISILDTMARKLTAVLQHPHHLS